MIVTRITVEDANGSVFGHVTYPDQHGDIAVHVAKTTTAQEAISLQSEEVGDLIRALEQAKKVIFPGAK